MHQLEKRYVFRWIEDTTIILLLKNIILAWTTNILPQIDAWKSRISDMLRI